MTAVILARAGLVAAGPGSSDRAPFAPALSSRTQPRFSADGVKDLLSPWLIAKCRFLASRR